jgi:hypothetical protein
MNNKSFQLFALLDFIVMEWCVYVVLLLSYSLYGELRVLLRERERSSTTKKASGTLIIKVLVFFLCM